ncbi:hypothetical protein BDQ12DRAFT_152645 [Crucibulum laeve]|uniref:Uncharacterized protein n=1 Tax=Crucibulum laeve TaxID=68775 RepID=A0A5C3LZ54_9AGAR|nr:hypothetical protein BDQ12DRAFT_152645 [Crucibulum laeve]
MAFWRLERCAAVFTSLLVFFGSGYSLVLTILLDIGFRSLVCSDVLGGVRVFELKPEQFHYSIFNGVIKSFQ